MFENSDNSAEFPAEKRSAVDNRIDLVLLGPKIGSLKKIMFFSFYKLEINMFKIDLSYLITIRR